MKKGRQRLEQPLATHSSVSRLLIGCAGDGGRREPCGSETSAMAPEPGGKPMIVRTSKNKCFPLQAARREAQREMALMAAEDVRSIQRRAAARAAAALARRAAERERQRVRRQVLPPLAPLRHPTPLHLTAFTAATTFTAVTPFTTLTAFTPLTPLTAATTFTAVTVHSCHSVPQPHSCHSIHSCDNLHGCHTVHSQGCS